MKHLTRLPLTTAFLPSVPRNRTVFASIGGNHARAGMVVFKMIYSSLTSFTLLARCRGVVGVEGSFERVS